MAEERRRRRRGRRGTRGGGHSSGEPSEGRPEGQEEGPPEVTEESEAPGVLPPRLRFRFGRGRDREEEREERRRRERDERRAGHAPADISPLAFWRRGRHRTYRDQPMPKQTLGRTWRRIRGMYFPPWVPVLFVIVVVLGILGALFVVRSTAGKPLIGQDHWHATYSVFVCGQRQPNFPTWDGGVHTHADGIIHIHPFVPSEEGSGARLVKWFEYGGGKLSQSEMRMPGSRETFKNGDKCDDGSEAVLQVFVNDEKLENWSRYIPRDGDRVRIVFGPGEAAGPVQQEDRIVIPESEAGRTVELEVTGGEADAAFSLDSLEMTVGETVKLVVTNSGSISHSVRVAGADGSYETRDDFVSEPEIIQPGEEGVLVVRFDAEGDFAFQDPTSPAASGTIAVSGQAEEEETPEPTAAAEPVDVTLDLSLGDHVFQPNELEVEAGQKFRVALKNDTEFVHNLRLAGPDGEFDTADDIVSTPDNPAAGEDSELVGQIDEPGTYLFQCDFHPREETGTLTVK